MLGRAERSAATEVPYSDGVLALTLDQARTIAMIAVVGLVVLAIGSAWLMKTLAQKLALVAILGLLAVVVWSQRASLQECADKVRAQARTQVTQVDTTCTFFGRDVTISTVRDD